MAEILCRTTYYIIVRVSVVLAGFLYMGPFLSYQYHVMDVVLVYIGYGIVICSIRVGIFGNYILLLGGIGPCVSSYILYRS